jgi:hypothetical protein
MSDNKELFSFNGYVKIGKKYTFTGVSSVRADGTTDPQTFQDIKKRLFGSWRARFVRSIQIETNIGVIRLRPRKPR